MERAASYLLLLYSFIYSLLEKHFFIISILNSSGRKKSNFLILTQTKPLQLINILIMKNFAKAIDLLS